MPVPSLGRGLGSMLVLVAHCVCVLVWAGRCGAQDGGWVFSVQQEIKLEDKNARLGFPQWSPDGQLLLAGGTGGIYLFVRPFTSPPENIMTPDYIRHETIYKMIFVNDNYAAFVVRLEPEYKKHRSQIRVYDVRNGDEKTLLDESGKRFAEIWPLEGDYFAVSDGYDFPPNLQVLSTDGRPVTRDSISCGGIVYLTNTGIWVAAEDPRDDRRINFEQRVFMFVGGSRASDLISLSIRMEGDVRAVVMNHDGIIEDVLPKKFNPAEWSRDGRYLLGWEGEKSGPVFVTGHIAIFDVETGDYAVLTDAHERMEMGPTWCEATGEIAFDDRHGSKIWIATIHRAEEQEK